MIHAILCSCLKIYIGKSTGVLRSRVLEPKSSLRNKNLEAPLTEHSLEDKTFFFVLFKLMFYSVNVNSVVR